MKHLPATARELVDALDKAYPARCIRPDESLESAHRYAGARDLIDTLIYLRARDDRREETTIIR